jgi:hypothetical protein
VGPLRHAPKLALALTAAVLAPPSAGATPASFLVYSCNDPWAREHHGELCRVNADGRGQGTLTSDGDPDGRGYFQAAIARGGGLLTFTYGVNELPLFAARPDASSRRPLPTTDVRHPAVSDDGSRLAYAEATDPLPGEPPTQSTPVLHTMSSDGTGRREWARWVSYPTWWGDRLVAVPGDERGGERVCVMKDGTGECERPIAELAGHRLRHPAISPDGRLVAAVTEPDRFSTFSDGIFLFSTETGKRVGAVTTNDGVERPVWSPDGQAIAFQDGREIAVVPRGNPKARQRLAAGDYPTWGGAAGTKPSRLKVTSVSIHGRRIVARGSIAPGAHERFHVSFTGATYVGYGRHWWPKPGKGGRFTITHTIHPGDDRDLYLYRCRLVVTYPGDSTHKRSTAYREPRTGVCKSSSSD